MRRFGLAVCVLMAAHGVSHAQSNDFSAYRYDPKFDSQKYEKFTNSTGKSNFRADPQQFGGGQIGKGYITRKGTRRPGDVTRQSNDDDTFLNFKLKL
ncbi:MAG: hypothetical protein ACR2OJ_00695 [Hyphomicrobiales bacterium]